MIFNPLNEYNMELNELLTKMWRNYTAMNPQAKRIHDLFTSRGEEVQNDHIALRTFNDPLVNIDVLARPFIDNGYVFKNEYNFTEKKLFACHFEHEDENMPKIFISELELEKFSPELQDMVQELINQVPDGLTDDMAFSTSGRPWKVSYETYQQLKKESEYAAWMAAHGYRPNHFTISVNHLKYLNDLKQVNAFIKDNGFKLNDSGGEIKGSPEVKLEQSSTLADTVKVKFTDGEYEVPACYYEFAYRYPVEEGGPLYQGFVAKSADKIFESTDRSQ